MWHIVEKEFQAIQVSTEMKIKVTFDSITKRPIIGVNTHLNISLHICACMLSDFTCV